MTLSNVSRLFCDSITSLRFPLRNMSTASNGETFSLKKALVLTKFSRYEYENRKNPDCTEEQLFVKLSKRGSDLNNLKNHHAIHTKNRDQIVQSLIDAGIETKMVNRHGYNAKDINWADAVITVGGDGTFLLAASHIVDPNKPLIGINSDAESSSGHLCLPSKYSSDLKPVLEKIKRNEFQWKLRQRIRVTIEGENANDEPIELHDQQLQHPENRFLDLESRISDETPAKSPSKSAKIRKELPFRALNEVFIGESVSSRVSYCKIGINSSPLTTIKSSGITVSTGTGSTSWYFSINQLTPQCLQSIIKIVNEETGNNLELENSMVQKITNRFNDSLLFDASELKMAYAIRDPISFGTGLSVDPRGFTTHVTVKSRMFDACLVLDGGLSYKFNDGAVATMQILPEDALRTIQII